MAFYISQSYDSQCVGSFSLSDKGSSAGIRLLTLMLKTSPGLFWP